MGVDSPLNQPWWALPNTPLNSSANQCTSICLKSVRRSVEAGDEVAESESSKAVTALVSPVAGTIRYVNNEAADDLSIVTTIRTARAGFFKIELEDDEPDLLSADEYAKIVAD